MVLLGPDRGRQNHRARGHKLQTTVAGAGAVAGFNVVRDTGAAAVLGLTKITYTLAGAGFVEKYRVSNRAGAGAPVGF